MSNYGITDTGFIRKRLDEILNEIDNAVKGVFGEEIDLSPQSPDGQINGVLSESFANLWEIAEASFNAFDPNKATGTALSNLVQLNDITRNPATFSTVTLTLTGTAGTVIPAGSLVESTTSKTRFATDSEIVLTGGSDVVTATATVTGPKIAPAGTVTSIVTPITNWDTVTNTLDAVEGTDEESDEELRQRRKASFTLAAQNILDAMYDEVVNTEGVINVIILENDTDVVDINGLPPHSFKVIVLGGDDNEIANAIFINKPAGITSVGSTSVQVTDNQGFPKTINFQRPTNVPIYVVVDITAFPEYPADGDAQIKQAIVDYAEGRLIAGKGFSVGDDVIYSEIYTPINTVEGVQVDSLTIGTSPAPVGTSTIAISFDEISTWDTANIVVNS